jgi:hypothetical protein
MPLAFAHALIASSALAGGAPAAAQPAPPPADQSTIVVTGQRNTKERITDFVRALTPVPWNRQISRFEQSVCPAVSGLPAPQEQAVAKRIAVVAKSIGLDVGGARCTPNIVVIVTADKAAFLQQLRRYRADYFGDLTRNQVKRVLRQPGPAAAWQLAGPDLNASGVEINYDPSMGMPVNRTTDAGSRITAAARPQFESAVVVIERGALDGLTTTQLADYAAMRAFARIDATQVEGASAPTILRVLETPMGAPVPITMTEWDFGFLRGLYTAPPNLSTAAQRSEIAKTVANSIASSADPPEQNDPRSN